MEFFFRTMDENQLAKAFRQCRSKHFATIDSAAVAIGLSSNALKKRELGYHSIKLIEFFRLAKAANIHPCTLLWELLSECDRSVWETAAQKLGCPPMQARNRLEKKAAQLKITPWQVWLKVEKDQITV